VTALSESVPFLQEISSLRFWRKLFLLKFEAVYSRSPVDHAAGHLPGFETEGAAPSRELFVPGDEEMLALETIDSLFFQMTITHFKVCWIALEISYMYRKRDYMSRITTLD